MLMTAGKQYIDINVRAVIDNAEAYSIVYSYMHLP